MKERGTLIRHMLDELDLPKKSLSKWEQSFIASVTDQFERKGTLTDQQFEKLQEIYEDKTA